MWREQRDHRRTGWWRGAGGGGWAAMTCLLLSQPQAFIYVPADGMHYHSHPCRGILPRKGRPGRLINCTASDHRVRLNVLLQNPGAGGRDSPGPKLALGHCTVPSPLLMGPVGPSGLLVPCPGGMFPGAQLTCLDSSSKKGSLLSGRG